MTLYEKIDCKRAPTVCPPPDCVCEIFNRLYEKIIATVRLLAIGVLVLAIAADEMTHTWNG